MRTKAIFGIAVILTSTGVVHAAGLNYTSQERYVSADSWVSVFHESDTLAAPDFGVFDETLTVKATNEFNEGTAGIATQNSTLDPWHLHANGEAIGAFEGSPAGTGSSAAFSYFDVTFTVTEPLDYTLTGSHNGYGYYSLTGPSLNLVKTGTFIDDNYLNYYGEPIYYGGPDTINQTGVLQPGDYQFTIYVTDMYRPYEFTDPFTLDMVVTPEPATAAFFLLPVVGLLRRSH